jgi:FdhD protein
MVEPSEKLRRNTSSVRVTAVKGAFVSERPDRLATEEPMEIRVSGPGQEAASVAVTMRTPGGDFELAAGFLFTEGLVSGRDEVAGVSYCEDLPDDEQLFNVVTVRLNRPWDADAAKRNFYATSSCGICGKASLDEVEVHCSPVAAGPRVSADVVRSLPDKLREGQRVFDQTGGLHAAGLFDAEGVLVSLREDVGRHNAVDKLVGEALLADALPLTDRVLQVSGRISFEIVQKAAMGGISIISAISAPSSLAVEAAERLGVTVLGFVRDDRFNIYSNPQRLVM